MPSIIEVRKTYKYRLYQNDRNKYLVNAIDIAGIIWNHALALSKRYYRRYGTGISFNHLRKHIAKLRMRVERYDYWRKLGSQAVQDVIFRLERAYERFFNRQGGFPRFKKVKKYSSFTLTQAGWKLGDDTHRRGGKKHPKYTGHIKILGYEYKFVKHRPMNGDVKTVTIKRDAVGRLWICFSVIEKIVIESEASTGKIGGFDFGLKTFLTADSGQQIESPQFFSQDLPRLRTIQRQVSKKTDGSRNKANGKKHIARRHIRIADKRRDFHFQLAHDLCDEYDTLVFETLNIDGMKRLWGKKISDLGFAQFAQIIKWVALKRGKQVIFIDRWTPTTKVCSSCGQIHKLELGDRTLHCDCGLVIDRDHNAAINIRELGHQFILSQSEQDPE